MLALVSDRYYRFVWLLAGLGFVPFALCFGAALNDILIFDHQPKFVFVAYSAAIASFLSGTVWACALQMKPEKFSMALMLLSNAFVLVAWFCILLHSLDLALGVMMILYPVLLNTEKSYSEEADDGYMRMRRTLTWMVFAVHLLMITLT